MAEHDITWFSYGKEDSPDKRFGDGSVEDVVSHLPIVKARLRTEAEAIHELALMRLITVPEHRTGGAKLGIEKRKLDWEVFLADVYDEEAIAAHNSDRLAKWHKRNNKRIADGKPPLEPFQPTRSIRGGAANSIENGHWTGKNKTGRWVEGLHIIQGAVEVRIKAGRKELK